MVKEEGSDYEFELCQVCCDPEKDCRGRWNEEAAQEQHGPSVLHQKYNWIRIVDNGEAAIIPHSRAEEPPGNAGTTEGRKIMNNLVQ